MVITIVFSHLRRPNTIVDRIRKGNVEGWYEDRIHLHCMPAEAVRWILENGPKIKGFVFRHMEASDYDDSVPSRPVMYKEGKYLHGDSEAELILRGCHRHNYSQPCISVRRNHRILPETPPRCAFPYNGAGREGRQRSSSDNTKNH